MKVDAVGVTSSDFVRTVTFYKLLGFKFPEIKAEEQHIEAITSDGSTRFMIDSVGLTKDLFGEAPIPSNHSTFAIQYDSPAEIDKIVTDIKMSGFKVAKEPWDAFWGQHYAVVEDPDGYKVDLYSNI